MRKIIILTILLLIFVLSGFKGSYAFSYFNQGARPIGMGGAFVAVADDSNSIFYNPAGLGFLEGTKLDLTHGAGNADTLSSGGLILLQSFGDYGCIGIGRDRINTTLPQSSSLIIEIQDTSDQILFSYSKSIDKRTSWGINYRVINRRKWIHALWIPPPPIEYANGAGIDIGLLHNISEGHKMGLFVSNAVNTGLLWDSGTKEAISSFMKIGISNKILEDKLLLSADVNYYLDKGSFNLGGEYEAFEWLFLRGGYNTEYDPDGVVSAGVGAASNNWGLDLAYLAGKEKVFYVSLKWGS